MKYRKLILSFATALVSFVAWSSPVDVIRVISSASSTPTYIRFDEYPSIKYSDSEVLITTQSSILTFDFRSNPSIVFMQVEEAELTDLITITATEISSSNNIQIFNLSGQLMDKANLTPDNYIVKTPSRTFKFYKK